MVGPAIGHFLENPLLAAAKICLDIGVYGMPNIQRPHQRVAPHSLNSGPLMEVFPNGFLAEIHCLVAIHPSRLAEMAHPCDFSDAEAGELLLTPAMQRGIWVGMDEGMPTGFVGAGSMAGATVAEIRCVPGSALIEALDRVGQESGHAKSVIPALLQEILNLSNHLAALGRDGVRTVRAHESAPQNLIPVGRGQAPLL